MEALELTLIKKEHYELKPFGKFIIKWKCSSQMAKRNDILDFNTTSFDSRTGMPYTTDDEKLFEKYMKKHKTDVLIDCMGDFYTRMGDNWVEISHTKLHKYKDYLLKMNDYKNIFMEEIEDYVEKEYWNNFMNSKI